MHFTSVRPSRHFATGVRQYQSLPANSSSPALYVSQKDSSLANSQASWLFGASPKYSVAAALALGESM
jgi:hypothetical protein